MIKYLFPLLLISLIKSDAVCTLEDLKNSLRNDIRDNNKLDCLRKPRLPPTDRVEDESQRKNRLAAVWNSDCSFEAEYDWFKKV